MKLSIDLAIRRTVEVECENPDEGRQKAKEILIEDLTDELLHDEFDRSGIETEEITEVRE